MDCSTARIEREISANGIEFDEGSVYGWLCKLADLRSAHAKRYLVETVLMIGPMAKLCSGDTVFGIAEWAKHRQDELVKLLCLSRPRMPSHHTYRRILAYKVYAEEVERLVGEYNQQGEQGTRTDETRTITTSEMLNTYAVWPGLAQVYPLERQFQ